jgi:mannose-1-phosphate guanylyltransferase
MAEFHLKKNSVFTMALYRAENPRECGIAELKGDTVAAFSEKPLFPRSNLANAGIYAASAEVFRYIPPAGFADFGHDVLPKLAGRMKGYMMNCFHIDVGNPRNYAKANIKRWRERGVGEKP